MNNQKGNIVYIILVIVGVLVFGYIVINKFVLPVVLNKVASSTVDSVVNNVVKNLNFDNAQSFQISQDLSKNKGLFLQIGINKGKISIDGQNQEDILTGEIKYLGAKPIYDYQTDKNQGAEVSIKSADQSGDNADIHLSQKTNGRIDIGLGAGSVGVDLTNLDIPILNISAGAGVVNVTFSKTASTASNLAAGAGILNISVYKGSGVKIHLDQSFSNLKLGDSYEKVDGVYQTKGYDSAKEKIELNIGQSIGGFNIQEI